MYFVGDKRKYCHCDEPVGNVDQTYYVATRNVYEEHCLYSMYSHGLRCMFYTVQWTVADGGPSLRLSDSTFYFYTVVST